MLPREGGINNALQSSVGTPTASWGAKHKCHMTDPSRKLRLQWPEIPAHVWAHTETNTSCGTGAAKSPPVDVAVCKPGTTLMPKWPPGARTLRFGATPPKAKADTAGRLPF